MTQSKIIPFNPHPERAFKKHMALYGPPEYIRLHGHETRLKRPTETLTCGMIHKGLRYFDMPTPEEIILARIRAGDLIICSDCGDPKERRDFFTDHRKRNGLYSECKECHRRRDRERKWALRNAPVVAKAA